jgi:hypothetical protein
MKTVLRTILCRQSGMGYRCQRRRPQCPPARLPPRPAPRPRPGPLLAPPAPEVRSGFIYIIIFIYVYVHICSYIYLYTYICIHRYICVYTHTYTHTHIYTFIYTYMGPPTSATWIGVRIRGWRFGLKIRGLGFGVRDSERFDVRDKGLRCRIPGFVFQFSSSGLRV